ncbi:MAG: peptide deformylase [Candidatus Pacebacteria bacterium]|nr:peptide deformylase [Candidatus Paceibacterota bacterium]
MKIITAPHPTLRQQAKPVKKLDKKILQFSQDLITTLAKSKEPKGVGLAANQVDKLWQVIALNIPRKFPEPIALFNPQISKHSKKQTLGKNPKKPKLEGCLSLPKIYGPVPRWQWIELNYQVIANSQLKKQAQRFDDFAARVIQHELDHLNGILFTDHCLQNNLPVYQEIAEELVEITDRSLLEMF